MISLAVKINVHSSEFDWDDRHFVVVGGRASLRTWPIWGGWTLIDTCAVIVTTTMLNCNTLCLEKRRRRWCPSGKTTKCEEVLENSPVLGSVWSGKKGSGMTTELMSYFLLSLAHISHRHISFPFAHYTAERSRAEQQSSSSAVTYLPSFPLRPIFIYLYPGPVLLYALSLWLLPKKKNIYFLFQPARPDSFRSPNVRVKMIISNWIGERKNVWEN